MHSAVPVMLAFGDHIAKGMLETDGQRFLDELNSSQSVLTIEEAQLFRLRDPQPVKELKHLVIRKERIVFGVPLVSQHEAPAKRALAHEKKDAYEAFVIAGHYELSGMLHQPKSLPESEFLRSANQFFPLTDVVINTIVDDAIEASVALVQTAQVNLIQIAPPQDHTESLSAKIRELLNQS